MYKKQREINEKGFLNYVKRLVLYSDVKFDGIISCKV